MSRSDVPAALYVVEDKVGKMVPIVRRGRSWLYLQPKYSYDKPRVPMSILDGKDGVSVEGGYKETAWLSKSNFDEQSKRIKLWEGIRRAIDCVWRPRDDISTTELEMVASFLGVKP